MEKGVFRCFAEPPLVIEFGAGKAYLSSMISDCTDAKRFVLVDNQSFKQKVFVDNCLIQSNKRTLLKAERTMKSDEALTVRRIRIDLKDFDLSRLPEIDQKPIGPWVALGKHLCGSGTDYALLACRKAIGFDRHLVAVRFSERSSFRRTEVADLFTGLFIATCCHHRCDWESYAARENFVRRDFTKEDFELVSWMTGSLITSTLRPCKRVMIRLGTV